MSAIARRLQILGDILPFFGDHVKMTADGLPTGSRAWMTYMSLYVTLSGLIVAVSEMTTLFWTRNWSSTERECETAVRQILRLFERWSIDSDEHLRQSAFVAVLEYPALQRIRERTFPTLCRQPNEESEKLLTAVTELSKLYERLGSVPERSEAVEKSTARSPAWDLREHLQTLHNTLSKSWSCQCRMPHEGLLFLATHCVDHDKQGYAEFDLLFGSTQLRAWHEAQVLVTNPRTDRRIRFQPSYEPPPRTNIVEHVCTMIAEAAPQSRLILIVNDSSLWKSPPRGCVLGVQNLVPSATFLDVLECPPLNSQCKIVFAVILAYNFLYLCESPWLPCPWDKRAIKFLRSEQSLKFDEILRPLIAARNHEISTLDALSEGVAHKDQARLALGIMLLEIFVHQAIEGFRSDAEDCTYNDADQMTTDTNLHTANRVFESIDWDVHEDYRKAVEACLDPADVDERPWDDVEHCQFIYTRVIRPLEQELEMHCGISVDDLDQKIKNHAGAARMATRNQTSLSAREPRNHILAASPEAITMEDDSSHRSSQSDTLERPPAQEEGARLDAIGVPRQHYNTISRVSLPLALFHVQRSNPTLDEEARKWFDTLDETVLEVAPRRHTTEDQRIKVAILDTGVSQEVFDRWKQERKTRGRVSYTSFVQGDSGKPPRDDADHGTHTAALLLRVAPNAEVMIARIADQTDLGVADSIVEAIRYYTTTKKVDIISMSFGFPQLDRGLEGLRAALSDAHAADIVLFAAGHNSGARAQVSYPANQDHVICIGSCDGQLNSSPFNPSPTTNMFCTLGEGIVTSCQTEATPSKSGTSFATPIAAGIAAILMDWVNHESRTWSEDERYHAGKVRTKKGIVNIFRRELSEERDGRRMLRPWNLFQEEKIGNAKGVLLQILMDTQV